MLVLITDLWKKAWCMLRITELSLSTERSRCPIFWMEKPTILWARASLLLGLLLSLSLLWCYPIVPGIYVSRYIECSIRRCPPANTLMFNPIICVPLCAETTLEDAYQPLQVPFITIILRTKHELVTSELCSNAIALTTLFFMGYHHNLPNYEPPGRQYHSQPSSPLENNAHADIKASFELSNKGFRKRRGGEEFVVHSFHSSLFPNLQIRLFIWNKPFSPRVPPRSLH